MPQSRTHFAGIGSDPEFLFATFNEFRAQVIPANTIITVGKPAALNSFIGTDNHAATAEMRPGPAHNIGRHLYDIAYGLHETDKWLASNKRFHNVKIVAQPFVCNEPLGGHVHCSFFVDNPMQALLLKYNRTIQNGRIIIQNQDDDDPRLSQEIIDKLAIYWNNYWNNTGNEQHMVSPELFGTWMDYLLSPYECAIQPWWDRTRRNVTYGGVTGRGEKVRQNISTPKGSKANKLLYLHYEYRVPSTWLCHPWLAYAYLGLAKLVMLNTEYITTVMAKENLGPLYTATTPKIPEFTEHFMTRFNALVKTGKWTQDIRGLIEIIPKTFELRDSWWEIPGKPVDIDAWRRLL